MFYVLTQHGIVGYLDMDSDSGSVDRYLVGRSARPVAVTYDPVEQVNMYMHLIYRLNYLIQLVFIQLRAFIRYLKAISTDVCCRWFTGVTYTRAPCIE